MYRLSKTRYCKGIQCPKMLWLDEHKPELADNVLNENIMANGNKVGELARGYFGDYALVSLNDDKKAMTDETQRYMDDGWDNIAEASFTYDGLYCAVDILHRDGEGWDIVEVKSSTKIASIYIDDMAFQYYVLTKQGVNVKKIYNMHIDTEYVRKDKLDLKGLLKLEDCSNAVKDKFNEIEKNVEYIRTYMEASEELGKDIGCYCENPYMCAYYKYCRKHLPEHSVFDIARMKTEKKYELYHGGIVSYQDIANNPKKVSKNQMLQVKSVLNNECDKYDAAEIQKFLATLSYPIYHLDFETFQMAVPEFDGCRPYQQIPFQYSLHIEHKDGSLEHREFLAKEGQDPRRELAESLVEDIPAGACSLAYNMKFEKSVLKNLAEIFPDLSGHLMDIHDNMHDLMLPFQRRDYYSAAMNGSYSIKYVLPALWPGDPELDYHNLDGIHNGMEASAAFASMAEHTPDEIADIRANLLKYCGLDTYAMVKVLRKLRSVCPSANSPTKP